VRLYSAASLRGLYADCRRIKSLFSQATIFSPTRLADPDSTDSGSNDGFSDYLLTRVDDEELAGVITDVDKIIAALKREYNPQRRGELKT
jgi:hypothetical protein